MESFFARYRNLTVLLVLLMGQIIVLASQVRRPATATRDSMSLMRVWVVEIFVPAEKALTSIGTGTAKFWRNYVDLRGVRAQNVDLQAQVDRLRLEQVRLAEDSGQLRRLQSLLAFKEKFISQTVAAQVIGTSGSEHSHVLYIDKGTGDGIKADMPVISPQGIIGKISKVFPGTSQVLEFNDATAGAGVMLERSRLRGVLHGTASGIPEILHVTADEKVEMGEPVVSSGGDQIYPRGLPIGTVSSVAPDPEGGPFMVVQIKPAANLDKVEEVLVITKVVDKEPEPQQTATGIRAADILAQRLPTVAPKAPDQKSAEPPPTSVLYAHAPKPQAGATPGTTSGTASNSKSGVLPVPKAAAPRTTTGATAIQPKQTKPAATIANMPKTEDSVAATKPPQSTAAEPTAPTTEPTVPKPASPTPPATDIPQSQENPR